jgi:hypothetical protein
MKTGLAAALLVSGLGGLAGVSAVDAPPILPHRRVTPKAIRTSDEIRKQRNKNKAAKKSRGKNRSR